MSADAPLRLWARVLGPHETVYAWAPAAPAAAWRPAERRAGPDESLTWDCAGGRYRPGPAPGAGGAAGAPAAEPIERTVAALRAELAALRAELGALRAGEPKGGPPP